MQRAGSHIRLAVGRVSSELARRAAIPRGGACSISCGSKTGAAPVELRPKPTHATAANDRPVLSPNDLRKTDAYWRAANYLSVEQFYLRDNPLLRRPLELGDIKQVLLGHWGTTPGQNFIYVHLNRIIRSSSRTKNTSARTESTCPKSATGHGLCADADERQGTLAVRLCAIALKNDFNPNTINSVEVVC